MEDIFSQVRDGKAFEVRMWLENTENDMNLGDDHRFSLLHWAAREGHGNIAEMLIQRGARINATNMGDDTALHLAAAHNHRDIVHMLLQSKANINAGNEHGNTPLHYATFWGYDIIAEDLVNHGAQVCLCNKYGETPLTKAKPYLKEHLTKIATAKGQSTKPVEFKDNSWLGMKTRTRDATLSRQVGINLERLNLQGLLASTHSGDTYHGKLQDTDIVAKVLRLREITTRSSRDFADEYPKLRIFNHPNVLPVMSASNQPTALALISQRMQYGSLFDVLHSDRANIVVDAAQSLKFALDIACGMEFLHSMEPLLPGYRLSSKHVMIDEDLTARISMADYQFSFHEKAKMYDPAWISPEALQRKMSEINQRAADMWSFAILLWEMSTREVPFAELSPMEIGMKVALEGLRLTLPHGFSPHLGRLISIAMNEEPGKRPKFDMLIPILQKMKLSS